VFRLDLDQDLGPDSNPDPKNLIQAGSGVRSETNSFGSATLVESTKNFHSDKFHHHGHGRSPNQFGSECESLARVTSDSK
jgi:hypothetical protein